MISEKEIYNTFYKVFLTENLDLPLTKILKLMNIDRSTFYNRFYYYENFVNKAFDYYFEELRKTRIGLERTNLFEIITQMNTK